MSCSNIRRPDAMLLPGNLSTEASPYARMDAVANVCRATLTDGTKRKYIYSGKDGHLGMHFVRLDPHESRCYPVGHNLYGSDRYEWFASEKNTKGVYEPVMPVAEPSDDGHVLLGYLKEDAHPIDPDTAKNALLARMEQFKDSPEYAIMIERFKTPEKEGISLE